MTDSTERDTFRQDRLPDVRPARTVASYTRFPVAEPAHAVKQPGGPPVDEPAWWEVDEVATLPDVRPWRAGSVVDSHLPLLLRTALNSTSQHPGGWVARRPLSDDPESILGGSRYGPDDDVPVWTDADTARERSSWKDESGADRGGRRQKRGKRNRQDRPRERRRDQGSR